MKSLMSFETVQSSKSSIARRHTTFERLVLRMDAHMNLTIEILNRDCDIPLLLEIRKLLIVIIT